MMVARQLPFHLRVGFGSRHVPILAMHGGMGLDHTYFRPWLDALGRDRTLIYYDHRGNGRSAANGGERGLSPAALAEDAEQLRLALRLAPLVVLAHSVGAPVAVEYARRHPCAGLVLCDPVLSLAQFGAAIERARPRFTAAQASTFAAALAGTVVDDGEFGRGWATVMPLYFHQYEESLAAEWSARIQFRARAFNGFIRDFAAAGGDVTSALEQVETPVLWIEGADDWLRSAEAAAVVERLHAGTYAVIADAGHFPFVEAGSEFLRVVTHWLASAAPVTSLPGQ